MSLQASPEGRKEAQWLSPGLAHPLQLMDPLTLLPSWPSLDCVPFLFQVLLQVALNLQENAPKKCEGDWAQAQRWPRRCIGGAM